MSVDVPPVVCQFVGKIGQITVYVVMFLTLDNSIPFRMNKVYLCKITGTAYVHTKLALCGSTSEIRI